jgi:hypothetical protein
MEVGSWWGFGGLTGDQPILAVPARVRYERFVKWLCANRGTTADRAMRRQVYAALGGFPVTRP